MDDFINVIQESLNQGKEVAFTPSGHSMEPTIMDHQDIVYLSSPIQLKKYDICLYYDRGRYVLHRIVRINKNQTYTMCGDHNVALEENIDAFQIIAKVSRYIHQKKEITIQQKRFYLIGFFVYHTRIVRKIKRRIFKHGSTHR